MKASVLLDMIGNTDERIIEEAGKAKKPAAVRCLRRLSVAACLCLAVAGGILFFTRLGANPGSVYGAGSTGHGSKPWVLNVRSVTDDSGQFIMMSHQMGIILYHSLLMKSAPCQSGNSLDIPLRKPPPRTGTTSSQRTGAAIQ